MIRKEDARDVAPQVNLLRPLAAQLLPPPTAVDPAERLGIDLASLRTAEDCRRVLAGESGKMVALQAGTIVTAPLSEACANVKTVPVDGQLLRTARDIGISFAAPKETKL